MYTAAIERVRPLIVALGAADELRSAGRWHAPSLEEWESIEKAIDAQETEQAQFEQRAGAQRETSDSDEEEGEEDARSEGDSQESDGDASEEDGQHYPEKIVKDRLTPGQRAKMREYLIKWRGWSAAEADLTWELHERLVEDGNAPLILAYLQEQHRRGRKLTIPDDLQAAADAEMGAEAEPEPEPAPPPPQPPIEPVDRPALIALLIAPIGSEQPNGIRTRALRPDATAAQRKAYDATRVTNDETGQCVHKATALAHWQKQVRDAKPGAGHQARY
eukprot:1693029-Prymnesium_polylepis.1